MRKVKIYKCHESGVTCVHVIWTFLGVQFWEKDFGPAYPDAIERAVDFVESKKKRNND